MIEGRGEEFAAELGELLRFYRLSAGRSESDVANAANLPRSRVSGFEHGKDRLSVSCFYRLTSALDLSPSEVLAQVEERLSATPPRAVHEIKTTLNFMASNRGRQLIRALSECDDPRLLDAFANLMLAASIQKRTEAVGTEPTAEFGP